MLFAVKIHGSGASCLREPGLVGSMLCRRKKLNGVHPRWCRQPDPREYGGAVHALDAARAVGVPYQRSDAAHEHSQILRSMTGYRSEQGRARHAVSGCLRCGGTLARCGNDPIAGTARINKAPRVTGGDAGFRSYGSKDEQQCRPVEETTAVHPSVGVDRSGGISNAIAALRFLLLLTLYRQVPWVLLRHGGHQRAATDRQAQARGRVSEVNRASTMLTMLQMW